MKTGIGKKLLSMLPQKAVESIEKLLATKGGQLLSNSLAEGAEGLTAYDAQRILENIILDKDTPRDVSEQLRNGLIGMIVGMGYGTGRLLPFSRLPEPAVRMGAPIAESGEPAVRLTDGNRLGGSDGPAVRMGAQMPEAYQWAGNALERVPASMIEIMNRRNAGEIVDGNGKIDHNQERTDGGEAWKDDVRIEGAGDAWYKADGSLNLPPNNGAVVGTEKAIELQPGSKFGRYGGYGKSSDFLAAPGSASDSLSLPPYTDTSIYQEFTVMKPIPGVTQSTVAPWGGFVGGGTQFKLPMTIEELIRQGYLRK